MSPPNAIYTDLPDTGRRAIILKSMYCAYILASLKDKNRFYIGITNNLERRLKEHDETSSDHYTYRPRASPSSDSGRVEGFRSLVYAELSNIQYAHTSKTALN
ncbi:MAG: GIY-YIG nuclease family protein [Candidatus Omnitrophica bacterium]|nr:GIY-YIG nuclease family protein [Candidatus Omnitrophota bacterium]